MYDMDRYAEFHNTTVKDVIEALQKLPQDAQVVICGDDFFYMHVEEDGSVVNLDTNDMEAFDELYHAIDRIFGA